MHVICGNILQLISTVDFGQYSALADVVTVCVTTAHMYENREELKHTVSSNTRSNPAPDHTST